MREVSTATDCCQEDSGSARPSHTGCARRVRPTKTKRLAKNNSTHSKCMAMDRVPRRRQFNWSDDAEDVEDTPPWREKVLSHKEAHDII